MLDQRTRTPNGRYNRKYICDDRGRQLIIDLYDGSKARTDELALRLGVSSRVVMRWAKEVGKHGFSWSQEEIDFLEKNFCKMSSEDIARRLGRTIASIRGKMQRMSLFRAGRNGYTMQDIMLGLGVTDHHKVERWISLGWLKGKKLSIDDYPARQSPWIFTDKAIREFILTHPDQINPRKLDQESWLWIVDILAGKEGLRRLDEDSYGERTS